jgi:hypothetical protein
MKRITHNTVTNPDDLVFILKEMLVLIEEYNKRLGVLEKRLSGLSLVPKLEKGNDPRFTDPLA